MSDPSASEPEATTEVDIDLTAFLPEGVTIDLGPDDGARGSEADRQESADGVETPASVESPASAEPPVPDDQDSIDVELLDAVEQDLNAVDAALRSLDEGTYGTCAVCRTVIPAEVLADDPVRLTCPHHV